MELRRGRHGLGLALVDGTVGSSGSLTWSSAPSRGYCSDLNLFLSHGAENAAEDERHLREVSRSRLACRSVSEAENRRPHPGR